jgi:hypothetical protein
MVSPIVTVRAYGIRPLAVMLGRANAIRPDALYNHLIIIDRNDHKSLILE